jgi:UPF0755 protein
MRKRIFKLSLVLLLIAVLALLWTGLGYQDFRNSPMAVEGEQSVTVAPGMSLNAVARSLQQQGLIENPRLFVWMARLGGNAARLQAGEYEVSPGMTPPQLLQRMVEGRVRQYAITVVEGITFRELLQQLEAHPALRHDLAGLDEQAVMAKLGHPGEHPEGRFLPETYHFPRGLSDAEFLGRAYRAMQERLEIEWRGRAEGLPLKSPYEALILASIVEKETGLESERRAIAGVFIRRLQKGMRLQTDPTVIYGLGLDFDGNLRRRDLLSDSPYNTYARRGLPPTPIAMPGADAIHAALHPDDGDALYFVARGDGSHHFSATLEEHNRAVLEYQIKGRTRSYTSSPQP